MSFNKRTILFLFFILNYNNNFFAMIKVVNPEVARAVLYTIKETYHYFVAAKHRFTGLADVVTENKNDEYDELKQYKNDVNILKEEYTKIKIGDNRKSYQMVTEKYCPHRNKFSESSKEYV